MIYPINLSFLKARINKIVTYTIGIRYVTTLALLGMPLFLMAQSDKDSTLVRTVVVEQEYNPDVMDASKINIVPKVEEPTVTKKDIEYSKEVIPTSSYGTYQELLPFTLKEEQPDAKRGYARLGYGNRGLLDAKAYYLMDLSSKDLLGITFSMDGRNEKLSEDYYIDGEWKYRYYRTKFLVDYTHKFNRIDLNVAGNFESDVFNYFDLTSNGVGGFIKHIGGKQHHTKAFGKINLLSTDQNMPLQFNIQTQYLYFDRKYLIGEVLDNQEHILRTSGKLVGEISENQHIALDVEMNNLFYSLEILPNYTTLDINPYYTHEVDDWKFKLGAHVDLTFNNGKGFRASPDIEAEYNFSDNYIFYLELIGGRVLNDYRRLEELSPYFSPTIYNHNDLISTYIPLNGKLGLKGSPISGLWFNIFAGYIINKDDVCFFNPRYEIHDINPDGGLNIYKNSIYNYFNFDNTKAFYLGLALDYTYKDILKFNFETTYYNWDSNENYLLMLKPDLELSTSFDVRIIKNLFFNLGYNYVKRPEISGNRAGLASYQMEAISNLSAGVTYDITKNFSAFVKGNNLLNKDYQYHYAYPAAKISFMGGVSLRF